MQKFSTSRRQIKILFLVLGTSGTVFFYQNCAEMPAFQTAQSLSSVSVNPFTDGTKLMGLPITISANATGKPLLNWNQTEVDSVMGTVFTATGSVHISTGSQEPTFAFPCNPKKTYSISGQFNAIGTSILYLGFDEFDLKGKRIPDHESYRNGSFNTIRSISGTSIVTNEAITGWAAASVPGYSRAIGFYYDGNREKRPDYVHYTWVSSAPLNGAYQNISGTTISLGSPLPNHVAQSITSRTVITNHTSGGTFSYVAASGVSVPNNTWTTYSGSISGLGFNANQTAFRHGTSFCKIIVLLNYPGLSGPNAKIKFTNLKISER